MSLGDNIQAPMEAMQMTCRLLGVLLVSSLVGCPSSVPQRPTEPPPATGAPQQVTPAPTDPPLERVGPTPTTPEPFAPTPASAGLDRDGDGVSDDRDRCPDDPEDRDGFEDEDGCPDPDNDGDGIRDVDDRCPNDAEDRDGVEDQDGCPDR